MGEIVTSGKSMELGFQHFKYPHISMKCVHVLSTGQIPALIHSTSQQFAYQTSLKCELMKLMYFPTA